MKQFLILLIAFSSMSGRAVTETPHPEVRPGSSWFGAMEASMMTPRGPSSHAWLSSEREEKDPTWLGWMGWIVAAACLFFLASLNLRSRRYQKSLTRDGEPDFFFLPPARNRRKRPR